MAKTAVKRTRENTPELPPKPGYNRGWNEKEGRWFYYKPAAKIPAPNDTITPMPPSVTDFLAGDTTYQDQESQLRRAYAEFVANQNLDRNNYGINFGLQMRALGKNRDRGFTDLQDDFAGRGLLKSGLYAKSYSDLQSQYDDQQAQMDAARAQYESGLNAALAGFTNDQQTTLSSAKQEAIARRAAKYNLGV